MRKLREKEDAIGMRVVPGAGHGGGGENDLYNGGQTMARGESGRTGRSGSVSSAYALETIMSESERGGPDDSGSGTVHQQFPGMNRSVSSNTMLQGSSMSLGGHGSVAEGVVDYARHTPGTARWERTLWKKLEVGDVVLLRDDDQVPADIVVLNSSDPDGNAYIETKNLDGETNLKVRKSLKATMGIQSEEDIEHARFVIDSEPPHANLYSYNGLLKYTATGGENGESGDKPTPADSSAAAAAKMQSRRVEPVTINELLLRGCAIRNTEWVIGLVVFTGDDTKIMLNGGETPSKRSKIEKETNFNVLMNFIILMAMCTICAVVGGLQLNQTNTSRNYYEQGAEVSDSNVVNALIIFG